MKILITAGPVYGRLDDNKLIGNRTRGIWAAKFAEWLMRRGHSVTLLAADTNTRLTGLILGEKANVEVVAHTGFHDYRDKCYEMAKTHDAAVLASAVVNWIPAEPISGKMATKGYKEGDVIDIPFVLAERVIDRMRKINPSLTLIGCKMLVGSTYDELIDAAYQGVILTSKANVVLANDLTHLRTKHLVYPDRTVQTFENDWKGLYKAFLKIIQDQHWQTEALSPKQWSLHQGDLTACAVREVTIWCAKLKYDAVFSKYRDRLSPRGDGKVFGSWLVRGAEWFVVSPREKDQTNADPVGVQSIDSEERKVMVFPARTGNTAKATMNAPLLVRVWEKYQPKAVLHLHEQLPGVPTVPYAPPGTDRDNMREIPGPVFNIKGHGFIACLDDDLEIMR